MEVRVSTNSSEGLFSYRAEGLPSDAALAPNANSLVGRCSTRDFGGTSFLCAGIIGAGSDSKSNEVPEESEGNRVWSTSGLPTETLRFPATATSLELLLE